MAIDPPAHHAPARRVSARTSTALAAAATNNGAATRRRVSARSKAEAPEEDEAEARRVFKKRRTSSEAPEEYEQQDEEFEEHETIEVLDEHREVLRVEDEADPNGNTWDDLDEEDQDDPLMVSEYVVEIFEYLKVVEQTTLPNPNYMENQKDLAWKMRGILTDWLIQVHMRFRLLPETLFLAVNIIDRFLSARVVSLAKLQLVGITCMFLAAKVEEIVAPSASNFLYCADSSYTEAEILQAEKYILKTLDWNMSYPNPIHFLRRVSKADEYNVQVRTVGKYLMEIECVEWRLIAAPPSLLAAASIWLARLVLGREDWTPNLAHYSSYPESALIPTANLMLNYILKPVRHPSFYKKYASKKYMKSSAFVRDWAIQHWTEGTLVDLEAELPTLKRENRLARERAIAEGLDPDTMAGTNLELGP
ncbi:A/B/D/E cyclin [Dentipellis sp. KUC8613]|nr:A/B/D/E cyclin [Dentipellis sp. KUC8613]